MRILFVADVPIETPVSGSEQVLFHQAVGMRRGGETIWAISRKYDTRFRESIVKFRGIRGACCHLDHNRYLRTFPVLLKYGFRWFNFIREKGDIDAVVAHQPMILFSLLMTGRLFNIPITYVCHSPWHEEYLHQDETLRPGAASLIRRVLELVCLRRADRIVVLSRYMKRKIIQIHNLRGDRIDVNPGGIDLLHFTPLEDRFDYKERLKLPKGCVHLLTVRNLEPRMGLDRLLQAMNQLKGHRIPFHLTIAGKGPESRLLWRMVKELRLDETVSMVGFVPTEQLPQYYGATDFFVLPTRHLEGFGLVTLESMACGTPVLGTPVGGTIEILSGFDSEFIFQDTSPRAIANGIVQAVRSYAPTSVEYLNLRSRCREYVASNFSWHRHVNQLSATVRDTLNRDR